MSDLDFPALLHLLDIAVFERLSDDTYAIRTPLPPWSGGILGEVDDPERVALRAHAPFLGHFLADAEAFWWRRRDGAVGSPPFTITGAGKDYLLRAWAVRQGPRQLIVVLHVHGDDDLRAVLQTARERQLEHEELVKRVAPVHAAVDALARATSQLHATGLSDDQRDSVASLARVTEVLQGVALALPLPPKGTRGFPA